MDRTGQLFRYGLALPAGHPDNPYPYRVGLFYRFADLGNTRIEVRNDWIRIVAGLHGSSGAWDWESAILFSENRREDTSNGLLHLPALSAAIANGTYRFNGNAPNSQAPARLAPSECAPDGQVAGDLVGLARKPRSMGDAPWARHAGNRFRGAA
jgi:iron complex outermembrane receptor protein